MSDLRKRVEERLATLSWPPCWHDLVSAVVEIVKLEQPRRVELQPVLDHASAKTHFLQTIERAFDEAFATRPTKASNAARNAVDTLPLAWLFDVDDSVRHHHGGTYVIVRRARFEATREPCYVYALRGQPSAVWVRAKTEMEDGRFSRVKP